MPLTRTPTLCNLGAFGNACVQNATSVMKHTTANGSDLPFPSGTKVRIYYLTYRSETAVPAGQTSTAVIKVDGADVTASFTTLQLTSAVAMDDAVPASGTYYEIDASAAMKRIGISATNTATTGTLQISADVWGELVCG